MRFVYNHLDWRELANELAKNERIDELFQQLMLILNGDVEEAFRQLDRLSERFREQLGFDAKEFEQRLREQQFISGQPGDRTLTSKGGQKLRSGCHPAEDAQRGSAGPSCGVGGRIGYGW